MRGCDLGLGQGASILDLDSRFWIGDGAGRRSGCRCCRGGGRPPLAPPLSRGIKVRLSGGDGLESSADVAVSRVDSARQPPVAEEVVMENGAQMTVPVEEPRQTTRASFPTPSPAKGRREHGQVCTWLRDTGTRRRFRAHLCRNGDAVWDASLFRTRRRNEILGVTIFAVGVASRSLRGLGGGT